MSAERIAAVAQRLDELSVSEVSASELLALSQELQELADAWPEPKKSASRTDRFEQEFMQMLEQFILRKIQTDPDWYRTLQGSDMRRQYMARNALSYQPVLVDPNSLMKIAANPA